MVRAVRTQLKYKPRPAQLWGEGGGRSRKEERREGKKRAEARVCPILNTADRERVWAVLVACFLSNGPSCPHRPCAASCQVPESSNETPFVKGVTFLEGGV